MLRIMAEIKYKNALIDGSEHSVDIDSVDQRFRREHTFRCPCCGVEMTAVLGEDRTRHFRHLGSPCAPDFYLHSTAEHVFYEEYTRCLNEGRPFYVTVYQEVQCIDNCSIDKSRCSKRFKKLILNLTDTYKKISPEQKVRTMDGCFRRPDLLLEDESGKNSLWVEIWVTHKTDKEKRKFGDVLEIKIDSEEDIQKIREQKLFQKDPSDDSVRLYLREPGEMCDAPNFAHSFLSPTMGRNDALSLDSFNLREVPKTNRTEFIKSCSPTWIDLGLPSGTLWSSEYMGSMSFEDALKRYPSMIPSPEQFEELVNLCTEQGLFPAGFVGPNGSLLEFLQGNFWTNQGLDKEYGIVFHREFLSRFVSSAATNMDGNCFAKAGKRTIQFLILAKK